MFHIQFKSCSHKTHQLESLMGGLSRWPTCYFYCPRSKSFFSRNRSRLCWPSYAGILAGGFGSNRLVSSYCDTDPALVFVGLVQVVCIFCVLNVCCVFMCICFESNMCVWPCCSPDPLLVSVHITQFSANWIIYDDSSYIALYHWNTIYCFIALDHQFIICTNQLLSYSHLCKLDHHQLLLSRSLYQDFKCCPLLFPHFQLKSIRVKRAKTKASQI